MRIGAFDSWAQTTGHAIAAPPQRPRNSRCRISALSGELLGNLAVLPEIEKLQSLLGTVALGEDKEKRPARASRFRLALKPYFLAGSTLSAKRKGRPLGQGRQKSPRCAE